MITQVSSAETWSFGDLCQLIARAITEDWPRFKKVVIAVDGFTCAGKTYLAKRISDVFNVHLTHLDDYLSRHSSGSYSNRIDSQRLRDELSTWMIADLIQVIEGTCIRDVLDRYSLPLFREHTLLHIYVKRLSANSGLWHPGIELEEFEANPLRPLPPEPDRSVLKYHASRRPHKCADVVFCWRRTDQLAGI